MTDDTPARAPRRRRPRPVGPFSRPGTLANLDRRTKAGKIMRDVASGLSSDLGGDLSAAQKILVQSVAIKATRLALLGENLLRGDTPNESTDHHIISWSNSARLDLALLFGTGLERKAKPVPTIEEYLAAKAAKAADGGTK
jgi:hypothetical protein